MDRRLDHEEDNLSVFDSGWPDLEIGACSDNPDGLSVSIQSPTDASPDWVKNMLK